MIARRSAGMKLARRAIWLLLLAIVLPGGSPAAFALAQEPRVERPAIAIELVLDGFTKPVFVADPADGSGRLFVVEKRGLVRIVRDGERLKQPFLDIREIVNAESNEQGLLSLAFHPDYRENGRFFVAFTNLDGDLDIVEMSASPAAPDIAATPSRRPILRVPKPYDDHNGGMLAFGPDGYLYISVGDGGAKSETDANAQRLDLLLGKILRVDIDRRDGELPYAIPPDNPFAATPGARAEIWAYGLRNPWRFSFDRLTGDLLIADVGLWKAEEVNVQPAGSAGGQNYGWPVMEGDLCHTPQYGATCDQTGFVPPVFRYFHGNECAIVGGYRYTGSAAPSLDGWFLFGDFCSGRIKGLHQSGDAWTGYNLTKTPLLISSFGQDSAGELYVTDLRGGLYRIVARTEQTATPAA